MYTCIGSRRDFRGKLSPCTNTSESPSVSPVNGKVLSVFLCSDCAASRSSNPRQQIGVEYQDADKPNFEPEEELESPEELGEHYESFDLIETELP